MLLVVPVEQRMISVFPIASPRLKTPVFTYMLYDKSNIGFAAGTLRLFCCDTVSRLLLSIDAILIFLANDGILSHTLPVLLFVVVVGIRSTELAFEN